MTFRRIAGRVAIHYVTICMVLAVCLGEMAFRLPRRAIADSRLFANTTARFGASLQDVAVTAPDAVVLRGWFAKPAENNGDAVVLLHGIGDSREGMTGFAELFLSRGYEVLLPDLRAHVASDDLRGHLRFRLHLGQ